MKLKNSKEDKKSRFLDDKFWIVLKKKNYLKINQ
jgi:hypothetical protein